MLLRLVSLAVSVSNFLSFKLLSSWHLLASLGIKVQCLKEAFRHYYCKYVEASVMTGYLYLLKSVC